MHMIRDDIYWVGYIDWDLRNFHGYETSSGSTYNAYLIIDEQPTLIDTVKYYGCQDMIRRITEVIDPAKIRYIISNHTEMDHSGSIDQLLALCPEAEVVCSPKGAEGLRKHFKKDWRFKIVKTGDTLSLGKHTLHFVLMPMVHWPDSMATYSVTDKILFSNDAFGQHYASSQRYVDEVSLDKTLEEAAKYYANIVMPYGGQVSAVLNAVKSLPLDMICPSHGLIWRERSHLDTILKLYDRWAHYESDPQVVIIYDTMWHSTEWLAVRLYELFDQANIPVKLCNLNVTHISDVITDIMHSKVVMIGSPMLNNHMLPTVGALMTYMKGLKPKNRYGFTFGSYGWAPAGFKELEQALTEAGPAPFCEGVYVQYVPDESVLTKLKDVVSKAQALLNG